MEPLIVINGDRPASRRTRRGSKTFNGAVDRDQRRLPPAVVSRALLLGPSMEPLIVINGDSTDRAQLRVASPAPSMEPLIVINGDATFDHPDGIALDVLQWSR